MKILNCLIWSSAACLLVCMVLDGTFREILRFARLAYRCVLSILRSRRN